MIFRKSKRIEQLEMRIGCQSITIDFLNSRLSKLEERFDALLKHQGLCVHNVISRVEIRAKSGPEPAE